MRMRKSYASLYLPERLSHDLFIEPGEIYPLTLGKRKKGVVVEEAKKDEGESWASINSLLAKALGLPGPTSLNIIREKNTLRLGPIVGIMAGMFKRDKGSFGAQDRFFRSLLSSMRAMHGMAFVFTPTDIDVQRQIIQGYYLDGDMEKKWQRHWFPFPDVCYNRYVKTHDMGRSRNMMTLLSRFGVAGFNSPVGNKWTVYKRLEKVPEIQAHLPETRLLQSPEVLVDLLRKYRGVYIKPVNGCKGRDIKKVTRSAGGYLVKSNGYGRGKIAASPRETYNSVRSGNWGERLIAQQAIPVLSGQNHFDIRVMVQKDRSNQWLATGVAARVGGRGQVTTNLHTGGHAERVEKVLADRGMNEKQVENVIAEIRRLAVGIARQLDLYSSPLGDLGMDFIIDDRGKVWFLEVNPKPGRHSFSQIDSEVRRSVVSKPMEYACYLAGF